MALIKNYSVPDGDRDTLERFLSISKREGGTSKVILEFIKQYVKEHEDTNNPQTTLVHFDNENITACPNLYRARTVEGENQIHKFLKSLNDKDFKEFSTMLDRWLFFTNKVYQEK